MTRSRLRKLKRTEATAGGTAKRAHLKLTAVPLVAAVVAGIAPAHAQEQQEGILEQIVVTAQKRSEDMQEVPLSIQAFGTQKLQELHIQDFEDYVKFLPSVSFTTLGPGFSLAYFRGVASGENNNHSGPQPSVGMYLDEQPITTIQGALDIHLYDVARVEALAGPQGTLYGASSQAGTIRIITNKPDATRFQAGYDIEGNSVGNGGTGYVAQGFVNVPLSPNTAIRLVGWYEEDAGFIDEVVKPRTYPTSGGCIENTPTPQAGCVSSPNLASDHQNEVKTYGARAALKIDLNENWTITPTLMGQNQKTDGTFYTDPKLGDLKVARYYPDNSQDKWWQAALTVEGRIGNFDLVYAGGYLKRDDVVNSDYSDYSFFYDVSYPGFGDYFYDDNGVTLADPSQFIHGTDGYTRQSHELRLSSPTDNRLRFVAGLFYQVQKHDIFQNYLIRNLGTTLEVPGWEDTLWLTNQARQDKDYAAFGELTFDITDKLTATAGARYFKSESSLKGFFGFNDTYSSNYGVAKCFSAEQFRGSPCVNLDDSVSKTGSVPRVNLTYHFTDELMVYTTYSKGFRPGGLNRNGEVPPYKPDYLTNYEVGWKTTWANRFRFNGAVFLEEWDDIQFSFLPPSGAGLTVIKNAGKAEIKGIEMDMTWAATDMLSLSGGASWLDAKLTEDYVPDPDGPPAARDGDRLPITPEFKANLTARLRFPVGSMDGYAQLAGVYNGSSFSDLLAADRQVLGEQPSYTIADFSAGVARDSWSLELYVNNATDERAHLYTFAQCATSVCGVNPYYVTNQPRTYGLKFGQRF